MGKKLTFKQYLDSKEKLREAVNRTPKRTAEYTVRKYCKLVVGESKEEKEYVNLKPKHKIFVEWLYENTDNPTILSIKFDGVKDVPTNEERKSLWQGERLLKWLLRNTREEN
jgi:hypothetical protein